mmetsp:Transcript_23647/g.56285  ORF Transcript_23647/g.56285 Transcript_23647/m.56285 type:complete len:264 (-) Transcript_23647:160-951(-)
MLLDARSTALKAAAPWTICERFFLACFALVTGTTTSLAAAPALRSAAAAASRPACSRRARAVDRPSARLGSALASRRRLTRCTAMSGGHSAAFMRGVTPLLSCTLGRAFASRSDLITATGMSGAWRGVFFLLSRTIGSALALRRQLTALALDHATCSGDRPLSLRVDAALPSLSITVPRTASLRHPTSSPLPATARWRGVSPLASPSRVSAPAATRASTTSSARLLTATCSAVRPAVALPAMVAWTSALCEMSKLTTSADPAT